MSDPRKQGKKIATSSSDYHLRILKTDTMVKLDKLIDETGMKKNELINMCLEMALPAIEQDIKPKSSLETIVDSAKKEILDAVTTEIRKTRETLGEVSISQFITELMTGSLYQLVDYMLRNIDEIPKLPSQVMDAYDNNIPKQFTNLKEELIKKLEGE